MNDSTAYNYICIDDHPIADFTVNPDELSSFVNEASFTNSSIGADTYEWSFGDGNYSNETNPNHTYSVDEDDKDAYGIQLIAYSELGCPDTAYTVLPFYKDLLYFIPNTFTPDGNMSNETFKPIFTSGFDPQSYTLRIFNRWGEVIFQSNDVDYGWDGSYGTNNPYIIQEGVYVWKIEFKKDRNEDKIEEVGHVNLLK